MSLRDRNFLQDKHLAKALQHAPDNDLAPNESARKAVLDYADNALGLNHKIQAESWFARMTKVFNEWQLPRWQLVGMGSLAASLLVVVMIWHENPDDPIQVDPVQVATAPDAATSAEARVEPSPETKLAQNELATGEVAKDDVNLAEQSPQAAIEAAPTVQAKSKSAKLEAAPQTAALEPLADKTVLASAPEAAATQGLEEDAESTRAKETAITAESAPVAAAPAPISQPTTADTVTSAAQKSEAEKPVAAAKRSAVLANAGAIGSAKAKQDIQAGVLRILVAEWSADKLLVDEATGYRVEVVTNLVPEELAAYNQTMRDWFNLKHLNQQ